MACLNLPELVSNPIAKPVCAAGYCAHIGIEVLFSVSDRTPQMRDFARNWALRFEAIPLSKCPRPAPSAMGAPGLNSNGSFRKQAWVNRILFLRRTSIRSGATYL